MMPGTASAVIALKLRFYGHLDRANTSVSQCYAICTLLIPYPDPNPDDYS